LKPYYLDRNRSYFEQLAKGDEMNVLSSDDRR
jgi:hypothetical protein